MSTVGLCVTKLTNVMFLNTNFAIAKYIKIPNTKKYMPNMACYPHKNSWTIW